MRFKLWYVQGGPKNNGRFAIITGGRFEIGRNHRPMTRNARERWFSLRRPKFGQLFR